MPITPEEKRILKKMQAKKSLTSRDLVGIVNPVFSDMNINPRYGKSITVDSESSERMVRRGIPKQYGGWTSKRAVYINNEMSSPAQIVTLAHETGHVVMKKALQKDVGKKEAERKGGAMERAFVSRFNKRYGKLGVELDFGVSKSKFKPRKGDAEIVRKNISTSYLRKGCKL